MVSWMHLSNSYNLTLVFDRINFHWSKLPSIETIFDRTDSHSHHSWQCLSNILGRESTNFWLMHMSPSRLGWLSTECWSSVSQDANQVSIECWPTIDWLLIVVVQDVDWHLPTMPLLHMIIHAHSWVKYLVLFMNANHVWVSTGEIALLLLYYSGTSI